MIRSREAGRFRIGQFLAVAVSVALGLGVAWWYFHGGKRVAEDAAKKAERLAGQAADAAEKDVKDTNASFDASRARQTEKRTGGLAR
ncbi:MAG: hypothetical protein HYZ53_29490 [Planctomycetes bacterium]|nr:hypothetical protein [Planctomycetota bacterium]